MIWCETFYIDYSIWLLIAVGCFLVAIVLAMIIVRQSIAKHAENVSSNLRLINSALQRMAPAMETEEALEVLADAAKDRRTTTWEKGFIENMRNAYNRNPAYEPTDKQQGVLLKLRERLYGS